MDFNLYSPSGIAKVMDEYGVAPNKRFGQNFLINEKILEQIVDKAGVGQYDYVLEIGPGLGALTRKLAEKGGTVLALEIDRGFIEVLKGTLEGMENVTVLHGDILKTDLMALSREYAGGNPFKVVANLPYYITTPVLMQLLSSKGAVKEITAMIQYEVAERILSEPGKKSYGALTLAARYRGRPKLLIEVPPPAFYPRPKVSSAVLQIKPWDIPEFEVQDEEFLFKLIRASFKQRRKTLANALSHDPEVKLSRTRVFEALSSMGKPQMVRGEALSLQEFAELANCLCPCK
ncbi:MAG: 16S rRNA (adenine(1518)-N(6)/adenine(1519)-N(6))-dimethyltransferase RsmA [Lachnospiraceae bacterium]|nr:16S rRNA (adenine(1518)-N(6)/adenine(1519)-N(6))-dimethyltransferase RsmA [Lachnospiraceae bacterium]